MLETMRNHAQSWISKVLLGGIVLSFALWGIGDYFIGSYIDNVAEVDGEKISHNEFSRAYERQLNMYRNMFGKQFDREMAEQMGLRQTAIDTLINRRLMLKEAIALDISAPNNVIAAQVRNTEAFKNESGQFDPLRYQQLTRNLGYRTPSDFEDEEKINLLINTFQSAVNKSVFLDEDEVRHRFDAQNTKRILSAIVIDAEALATDIQIDDKAARQYFDEHQPQYQTPLRISLQITKISPQELSENMAIDEAELKEFYETHAAEFIEPERRRASHILVRIDGDDEAVKQAARAKIDAALVRVKAGEDFATIATEISDDTSAADGGDLGFFARGAMVKPFEDAAFSLQIDEISDVITTTYGFHIIKLAQIQKAGPKDFASIRSQLEDSLRLEKAKQEAYALSEDLDDALGREDSLKQASEAIDLASRLLPTVSKVEILNEAVFANNPNLLTQTFARESGDMIEIGELGDGSYIAIEIIARINPKAQDYDVVAAQVIDDAKKEMANKKASQMAKDVLVAAKAGATLDDLAQQFGQPKYISKPVAADGSGGDSPWITMELLQASAQYEAEQWLNQSFESSQGLVVARVVSVTQDSEANFDDAVIELRKQVLKEETESRFSRWVASVRNRHEIVVHADQLERAIR
ncbi:MAG: SurA N-terminal domain-containing protein [Mariprofundales bacterium]